VRAGHSRDGTSRSITETVSYVRAETAKVADMGGSPGGLPVCTAFQLWSALVLLHVRSSISLVDNAQVAKIQTSVLDSVTKLVGPATDLHSVLADLGLPDAVTIRDLRVGNLVNRLRTLPTYVVSVHMNVDVGNLLRYVYVYLYIYSVNIKRPEPE
jgi:hypothetical protein